MNLTNTIPDLNNDTIKQIIEALKPKDYLEFLWTVDYTNYVNEHGPIDTSLAILLSTILNNRDFISNVKLTEEHLLSILETQDDDYFKEIYLENFFISQDLNETILDKLFEKYNRIYELTDNTFNLYDIMDALEYIKSTEDLIKISIFIFKNKDKYPVLKDIDHDGILNDLHELFSDVILNDDDSLIILKQIRPEINYTMIRVCVPCVEGHKRLKKWINNDEKYSYNLIIAYHLLSNIDEISQAREDLSWLSCSIPLDSTD